jgi:hypothetical protein
VKRAVTSEAKRRAILALSTDATDEDVAEACGVSVRTVLRVRTAAKIIKRRGRLASKSDDFTQQVLEISDLLAADQVWEEAEVAAVQRLQFLSIRTGQRRATAGRGGKIALAQVTQRTGKALGIRVSQETWERAWRKPGGIFGGATPIDADPFAAALFWRVAGESSAWGGGREWPAAWPTVARMMLIAEDPARQWVTAQEGAAVEARLTQRVRQAAQKRWREGLERRLHRLSRKDDPALATAASRVMEWLKRTP